MRIAILALCLSGCAASLADLEVSTYQTGYGVEMDCYRDYLPPWLIDRAVRAVADAAEGFGLASQEEVEFIAAATPVACFHDQERAVRGLYLHHERVIFLIGKDGESACFAASVYAHELVHALQEWRGYRAKEQDGRKWHRMPWFSEPRRVGRSLESVARRDVLAWCGL